MQPVDRLRNDPAQHTRLLKPGHGRMPGVAPRGCKPPASRHQRRPNSPGRRPTIRETRRSSSAADRGLRRLDRDSPGFPTPCTGPAPDSTHTPPRPTSSPSRASRRHPSTQYARGFASRLKGLRLRAHEPRASTIHTNPTGGPSRSSRPCRFREYPMRAAQNKRPFRPGLTASRLAEPLRGQGSGRLSARAHRRRVETRVRPRDAPHPLVAEAQGGAGRSPRLKRSSARTTAVRRMQRRREARRCCCLTPAAAVSGPVAPSAMKELTTTVSV